MKIRDKVNDLSIQKKLVGVYFLTTLLVLAVNLFMYININVMMHRLDQIYTSNINLNQLSDLLDQVQSEQLSEYENNRFDGCLLQIISGIQRTSGESIGSGNG